MPTAAPSLNWRPIAALLAGLIAVSTAAIFIRLAQEASAPSLVVAAARLTVASLLLTIPVLRRYRPHIAALSRRDWGLILIGGGMLGLHFATWISSLEYTSVTNSVVLVTTSPLWVALLAPFLINERLTKWIIAGLALAMTGGFIVAFSGEAGTPPTRPDPLLGNGLAVLGAITVAFYLMVGRSLRKKLPVLPYIWLVYCVGAITLLVSVLATSQAVTGYPGEAYLWMVLLALVPQLVGHSSFNYALGFFPAVYVSLITLAEPVASSGLAIIFLDEWPGIGSVLGALFILSGIAVASRDELRKARQRRQQRRQASLLGAD